LNNANEHGQILFMPLKVALSNFDFLHRKPHDHLFDPQGYAERAARSDPSTGSGQAFPGETFRVLKEKELRQHGEYRTGRLVLEAWENAG